MTPLFAHRAAEEFDRALEGRASRASAERHADLLGTVETLRRMPQVEARADFVADLRTRLMTAAETDLVPAPQVARRVAPTRTPATPARRRLGTVAASLVIVGGTAGMAAAASGALPGDSLYPVKRGVEDISTAVHVGDASKGRTLLDQAATRLDEARQLQTGTADDRARVADALQDFRATANDGADRLFRAYADGADHGDIAYVRDFADSGMKSIGDMSGNPADTDDLLQSADTLAQLDEQAKNLCAACSPGDTVTVPVALASSAGAADLDGLLSRPVTQAAADISAMKADLATERAKLRAQARAAENTAGSIPPAGADGSTPAPRSTPDPGQVTSTITPGGDVVTNLATTGTSAVKGLTKEVTGAVKATTKTGTPVDGVVSGVTDATDEAVDTLDGATKDLLRP